MKRAVVAATAAVMVALLAGCSAPDAEADATPTQVAEAPAAPEASQSEPAASTPSRWGDMTAEEFYLASLAGTWRGEGEPTEAEWLAAGYAACEEIAAGADPSTVRPLGGDGDDANENNRGVVVVAQNSLCYTD